MTDRDLDREAETGSQTGDRDDQTAAGEPGLACNGCRKRKLRCSREVPTCQHCRKTGSGCVYETKRAKPGMKAGAIDHLHRRLDALEKVVQGQQSSNQATSPDSDSATEALPNHSSQNDPYHILSFFAKEFQRFNDARQRQHELDPPGSPDQSPPHRRPAKRQRLDSILRLENEPALQALTLPDQDETELVFRAYFTHIHPWVPMVHEGRFRSRLSNQGEAPKMGVLFRAITLVSCKYIQFEDVARSMSLCREKADQARDEIVATAMRELSIENCQALIIVAFDDIGSGLGARAWPLVGCLSRAVEYLQLAAEHDEAERQAFCQPFSSLAPPRDWTEAEERRRIFWNTFKLDRICSVMMGWNTSLTSDDVSRRLPADGIRWRKEEEGNTPYFGIWDKSAGRIGNPIAFLPSHYAQGQLQQQHLGEEAPTPSEAGTSPGNSSAIDMSTVGAFAYSIEATESLSRVTTYFLQQKINMRDNKDLSSWLTRFKELDLRLVHWKMLLPQKWKVDVSRQSTRMDPNLTLAHVTHNASMIMLHQLIAFPLPEWPFKNRLPSLCSADTCQTAAVEIATIAENYLKNAPLSFPVASQFAFCLYIASRVLLLQWRHSSDEEPSPQFWSLLESLDAIARRWAGPHAVDEHLLQTNLAAKYSNKLKWLQKACSADESLRIHVLAYTSEIDHCKDPALSAPAADFQEDLETPTPETRNFDHFRGQGHHNLDTEAAHLQEHYLPSQPIVAAAQHPVDLINPPPPPNGYHRGSLPNGDLGAISQLLMDQNFLEMDRVISYDDGIFGSEFEGSAW